jgi:hypothetical protein
MNIRSHSSILLPAILGFYVVLTLLSVGIPFFWDSVYLALPAQGMYADHFNPFRPGNPATDTGGFPMYAFLLAINWKLFGQNLFVSHIALLPFLLGIAYEFYRLAEKYLYGRSLVFAMLLLCIEPCLITQGILMAYDLLLLYFFLAALNRLLENKLLWSSVFIVLLTFSSLRGIAAALALALTSVSLSFRETRRLPNLWPYLPAFLAIAGWFVYHHAQTGWYLVSPLLEKTDERFRDFKEIPHQLLLNLWKLNDSGRVFLWITGLFGCIWLFRKKQEKQLPILLMLLGIPLFVFLSMQILISNPVSVRYFMPVYLLLCLLICYVFQFLKKGLANLLFLLAFLGLLSGNFWMYPEKFSNEWDTSLKVLPFFGLEKQMQKYIETNDIKQEEVATQFPLIDSYFDRYLSTGPRAFTNALAGPVNRFHYYLHSNVCNTDLLPQIEAIRPHWKLLKHLEGHHVYLDLFENPEWNSGTIH